jgi:PAS domain S-box-containing protein
MMIDQILQFLTPPIFEDKDKTRAAGLLHTILLIILAALAIIFIIEPFFVTNPIPIWVIEIGLTVPVVSSIILMRRGYVRLASILLALTIWVGVTIANFVLGGLNSAAPINYIPVIIIAGLLLGGRAALGFAGLTAITGAVMLYSHTKGTFPPPITAPTPAISWLKLTYTSLATAILLDLAIRVLNTAIAQAHSNAANLEESNRQLRGAHTALENRTAELSAINSALEREIAERKRAEAALAEERNLLRTLIDNLPDSIYVKDTSSRFLIGNIAVAQIMGASTPNELIGKTDFDYFPHELAVHFYQDEQKVIRTGNSLLDKEEPVLNVAGSSRWFLTTKIALRDQAGNIKGIVGMSRDITERKLAGDRLKTSLQEKEVLLQEVHHRVKNNLQVISSLLNLQSQYIENQTVLEIFKESQQRIHSMSLIHEKLYRSENLASVDFGAYIRELAAFLLRSQKRSGQQISLSIQTDEVFLKIDTAVPCGLILNELVTNALKHAFPYSQSGEIRVELRAVNAGWFQLIVADNGIGLPASFDFKATSSLGLYLVNSLVKQLNGNINLNQNQGTEFRISFFSAAEQTR